MKVSKNKKEVSTPKKNKKSNKSDKIVSKKDSDLKSKNLDDFLQDWSEGEDENDSKEEVSENSGDSEDSGDENEASASKQKQYLASLKDKDPEFHKFLQENDEELLNFDESDSDEGDQDKDDLDPVHKLPESLEVASDDSDYEEGRVGFQRVVSL